MNIHQNNLFAHLKWSYISFFISDFFFAIPVFFTAPDFLFAFGLIGLCFSAALFVLIGGLHALSAHKREGKISTYDVVVQYVSTYIAAILFICVGCYLQQYISAILMSIGIIFGIAIIPVVPYRYRIRNKIKALFKKRK